MAIRLSSPCPEISRGGMFSKVQIPQIQKLSVHRPSHEQQPKRTSPTIIRSFNTNKVFEDYSSGIACYVDEAGEVICEGYDEGPRYRCPTLCNPNHQRTLETFDFPQQASYQIMASNLGTSENIPPFEMTETFSWIPLISEHNGKFT